MQLLCASPQHSKKVALKHFLLQRYSLFATERADRFLSLSGLVNRTAVDLMDNMLSLLGSDEGGFVFLLFFLCHLPSLVHVALANFLFLAAGDCQGLVEEADRVQLASRQYLECSHYFG